MTLCVQKSAFKVLTESSESSLDLSLSYSSSEFESSDNSMADVKYIGDGIYH